MKEIVPWLGPVPAPGTSNVVMVGAGRSKAVLRKFCASLLAPTDALVSGRPGAGLTACAVCDSAKQAKRSGTRRKALSKGAHLIDPLTQGIIVDLRCDVVFMCYLLFFCVLMVEW